MCTFIGSKQARPEAVYARTHLALVLAGSNVDTVGILIAVVVVSAGAEIGGSTAVGERVVGVTDPLGLTLPAVEAALHVTRIIHVILRIFVVHVHDCIHVRVHVR